MARRHLGPSCRARPLRHRAMPGARGCWFQVVTAPPVHHTLAMNLDKQRETKKQFLPFIFLSALFAATSLASLGLSLPPLPLSWKPQIQKGSG